MIIYNKEWLGNLSIHDQINISYEQGDISTDELKKIKERYPVGFYSPNIFMRVGIFLLTLIILGFSIGLLSLITYDLKTLDSPYYLLFLGLITYVALEFIISTKHHYRSGADDALMWVAAGLFLGTFIFLMDEISRSAKLGHQEIFLYGFSSLCAGYFTLRFGDALMAIVTILAFLAFICYVWLEIGFYSLQTLPFLMMMISGTIYYVASLLEHRKKYLLYSNCITAVIMISLLLFYLSGNYFVVREMGAELGDGGLTASEPIPFGWFFWLWTFIIPLLYIGFGLKKKNVILLRGGLVLVTAATFTLKNYYYIMPTELLLVWIGIVLIGIAWFTIKYLKTPKSGFTAAQIEDGNVLDKVQAESLIVGETFSGGQSPNAGHRMGGGSFGGGGAGSDF